MPTPALRLSATGQRAKFPPVAKLISLAVENKNLLSLAAGFTDNATLPVQGALAAAAAVAARPGPPDYLQYGATQGRARLRGQLAARLRYWEPELDTDANDRRFLVTNGSQQSLYIAVQSLCDPGDIVLVDRPSYFAFLDVVAELGARAVSLPYDDAGRLHEDTLRPFLKNLAAGPDAKRVKALYVVSYFSNPTGRCLGDADKRLLGRLLTEHGFTVPVIEDVAYRELFFEQPHPVRSTLTLPEWAGFPRFYCATLTKPFATGMKVGYGYCTDEKWLGQMLAIKGNHDFGTSNYLQAVFEEMLAAGGFENHLPIIRRAHFEKMKALYAAFEEAGLRRAGWSWERPTGGLYLWLRAPEGTDLSMDGAFCRACIDAGVLYVPGDLFFCDRVEKNWARLSFGVLAPDQLREAAKRFALVAKRFA